jgi:hypothetical protein
MCPANFEVFRPPLFLIRFYLDVLSGVLSETLGAVTFGKQRSAPAVSIFTGGAMVIEATALYIHQCFVQCGNVRTTPLKFQQHDEI